jgi:NAD-dependent SIR2 family protein deacetylase
MCWHYDTFFIGFFPIADEVNVVIDIDNKTYVSLSPEVQALFKKNSGGYRYQSINVSLPASSDDKTEQPCPDDQKLIGVGAPMPISVAEVARIIKTQKVIFYTGAGISACCVPAMEPLERDLGITDLGSKRNYAEFIVNFFKDIDHHVETMKAFFYNCEHTEPSLAHKALAQIIKKYNHRLYTENIDQLHQKTVVTPIVMPGRQKEKLTEYVKSTQYVVTVGLSADDGGFLKYCKQINPLMRIISINLSNTYYLSKEDFTLLGDIQKIMPELLSLLG